MHESATIRHHRSGAVDWVTVDAQTTRNALSVELARELTATLTAIESDRTARVVVLTGAGDRSFISGADIAELGRAISSPAAALESYEVVEDLCHTIQHLRVPVVAMVNGYALGAGCEVAVSCDLRVASATAVLGIPSGSLGITIGQGHISRLVQVVGAPRARDLLITARRVSADEALAIGLVDRVAEPARLAEAASELAETIAGLAPLSVRWARERVLTAVANPGWEPDAAHGEEAIRCFGTSDFREGVAAFLEKRSPRFTGD